ncbi:gamma-glutamylcyclotransferase [Aestuariispira insulae]|uniref:glutathione-specific gamma-glutamylcyclotransferase n=1 Tax=Aestuariispira insulae TaxID=1461337 RepID=A0A3D9HP51_9PROT|nr:gamma-glutamylcyclotransferase [Aestuariispira insulae]RED51273.1 cation transport protein ChaC [Aestuariispira insulae]
MHPTTDPPNAYPKLDEAVRAHMKRELLATLPTDRDIWVFGYGSLMWNPGFDHTEACPAFLPGWKRSFCVYSHRYRGTPEIPGLVLGLDRGGECHGMAFRVTPDQSQTAMDYLWEREMVTGVYEPMEVTAEINGKNQVCHTFVVDRAHPQYAGDLPQDECLDLIAKAHGSAGPNTEYLMNTVARLDALGIEDDALHSLVRLLEKSGG